jgi:hypothetical protein
MEKPTDATNTATAQALTTPSGSGLSPTMLANLKQWSDEDKRLSELSDIALLKEVLGSIAGDSLAVTEMMNRFRPGWEDEIISQNAQDQA